MKKNKQDRELKFEEEFYSSKVSFTAGLVLAFTIIKNILEIWVAISYWGNVIFSFVCLLVFALFLTNQKLDGVLKAINMEHGGEFMTVSSILFVIVDNLLIKREGTYLDNDAKWIMFVIELAIVAGFFLCIF